MAQVLFVVAQGNYRLYDYLKRELAEEDDVEVIMDRRRRIEPHAPERRAPVAEEEIPAHEFIIIRQHGLLVIRQR